MAGVGDALPASEEQSGEEAEEGEEDEEDQGEVSMDFEPESDY